MYCSDSINKKKLHFTSDMHYSSDTYMQDSDLDLDTEELFSNSLRTKMAKVTRVNP